LHFDSDAVKVVVGMTLVAKVVVGMTLGEWDASKLTGDAELKNCVMMKRFV
jgi:hypothetical protein